MDHLSPTLLPTQLTHFLLVPLLLTLDSSKDHHFKNNPLCVLLLHQFPPSLDWVSSFAPLTKCFLGLFLVRLWAKSVVFTLDLGLLLLFRIMLPLRSCLSRSWGYL